MFDGITYERGPDGARLAGQLMRVCALMADGSWRTLEEIRETTGDRSIAAISARLRDLRKRKFGGHTVERRRRGLANRGLFEYRMISRWKGPGVGTHPPELGLGTPPPTNPRAAASRSPRARKRPGRRRTGKSLRARTSVVWVVKVYIERQDGGVRPDARRCVSWTEARRIADEWEQRGYRVDIGYEEAKK